MGDVKQLRGQVRQIAKEMLPETLKGETAEALRKEIMTELTARLNKVEKDVAENLKALNEKVEQTLEGINARTKDIQDLMLRQALNVNAIGSPEVPPPPTDPLAEVPKSSE